ncbi:uncharacterized protein Gasu_57570 [Galdieria sulphuraria]|uniref:Uncharacterized protein n=1 Tax=Galdieria sulphuraria TaxID=130081 RepID=M2X9U0_GALSU|nr:uncharacterized protein Gasu_57570 [Galdieria sulphuraria]EME26637.1 hypothetical protein Gasu_57570 [Galdieria sulphuraria]|eukprot:XP_005703157.1 hypothetical protein Gasu_57570 [Galdieria sulphuraria]
MDKWKQEDVKHPFHYESTKQRSTPSSSAVGGTEPTDAYYEEDLLKVGDFISNWDGLLDENLGSILKNVLPELEEFASSSPHMEQVFLEGKQPSTELDVSQVTVESTEQILSELDIFQLADKFYKVIDRAWFQAVTPWKFCLMIYQARDPKVRSISESELNRQDTNIVVCTDHVSQPDKSVVGTCCNMEDEILFPKEQYILAYCLVRRIVHGGGGESPFLFRFFREAINLGYIHSRRAMEAITCLFFHHLSIANRYLSNNASSISWVDYLKSIHGNAFPVELFDWQDLSVVHVYSAMQWIHCIVDLMENFRFDMQSEESFQSKLILVETELLLRFHLEPLSFVGIEETLSLVNTRRREEEKAYMEEEVVQADSRVDMLFNDCRTVALIRVCGRRHHLLWKELTSWVESYTNRDLKKSVKLSALMEGLVLSWIDKSQVHSERQMDAESFIREFYDSRKLGDSVTTKIYNFWLCRHEPNHREQLGRAFEELAKAASYQREKMGTGQRYYQVLKQHVHMIKDILRQWLICPSVINQTLQERWGDQSSIASELDWLLYKSTSFPLDEYMSMLIGFSLTQWVVMYCAWNIYSSCQPGNATRISWYNELLEKWIRGNSLNSSRVLSSIMLWILYFSFHAKLVTGSVSTYFRIVRGISFIRNPAAYESQIAFPLCWIVMDELDKATEPNTLSFFSDRWPMSRGKWVPE